MGRLYSPKGTLIVGTYEKVPGVAKIDPESIRKDPNSREYDFNYSGETDLDWDYQKTQREDGERLFVDENWGCFKESELRFEE